MYIDVFRKRHQGEKKLEQKPWKSGNKMISKANCVLEQKEYAITGLNTGSFTY